MAKKEEDVGKRVSKLEQEFKKFSTQKVESTSERITGLEDQVDYAKQLLNTQQQYNSSIIEARKHLQDTVKTNKQIAEYKQLMLDYAKVGNVEAVKQAQEQIKLLSTHRDQAKELGKQATENAKAAKALNEKYELESKLTRAQREAVKIQEDVNKKFELRDKVAKDIADYEEQIKNTTGENADYVKKILNEKLKNLKSIQDANKAEIENLSLSEAQLKAREKLAKYEKEISESIGDSLGFLDTMSNTISSIPVVGGLLSKVLGVDTLKKDLTEKLTKHVLEAGSSFSAAFASAGGGLSGMAGGIRAMIPSISAMGTALYASLAPILPILLAITAAVMAVKKALEMDQEVTDMARGLGMSKDAAHEIHSELLNVAETTKVVGASSAALSKSYMDVAKSMGVAKLANAKMAETQVFLEKQMGMTTENAANFQKMSMAGGKTAYQNLAVIEAGVQSMTGGLMNYQEVAGEIASTSKEVTAAYKGNIGALTKAVVTAKKFGMTLEQTKKSADSILDIESSLASEMQANVLTGKNMNLNQARLLALQGDSAGAVEEMMKEAGGYDELMDMAPYKQKAIADAMGMTVDEMIKAAETQKNMESIAKDVGVALGKNGEYTEEQLQKAAAMNNEEAEKLLLQKQVNSGQEKMSALGDKLMATFGKLAEPLMALIDPIVEMVDFLFPAIGPLLKFAFAPLTAVFDLFSGIKKIFTGDILGGLKDIGAAIIEFFLRPWKLGYDLLVGFFPSIGKMVDDAMGWIKDKIKGLLPDWALKLLGMGGEEDKSKEAEAAGGEKLSIVQEGDKSKETVTKVSDAIIDPAGGLVVKGEKGAYQLNKEDSIVAGTNLAGSSSEESGGLLSGLGDIASSIGSAIGSIGSGIGSMMGAPPAGNNQEVVALLKELIAKVDQPINLTIGSKAIGEIGKQTAIVRSIATKADRSYGTFV